MGRSGEGAASVDYIIWNLLRAQVGQGMHFFCNINSGDGM